MSGAHTIVCPIDFSEGSLRALSLARDLAPPDGKIELVHVHQLPAYGVPEGAMEPDALSTFTVELARELTELAQRLNDPRITTHLVVAGLPHHEIVRRAEALNADLIVMGTHGRTGIRRLLLGSVAERVIRTSPVPVITVPPAES